ncbi:transcription factor GTE10-like isoform X1 [Bidens hawaiensis]|uniref:transcription factor GTE10-like isoform X1 n=1 Tax=Bidens hawaiensis TaxID=980011 RepID=UPI004049B8ED
MGKSRKVSKGYSYGFVPDYRHAVETMADSEGYGSSGRVDTENTASEVSCAPRNKSVNLVSDAYQQFGVPIQVISLSKLSSFERKELESRFKRELEQVRTFQKNIDEGLSPSSDLRSCSAGQRKPMPEFSRNMKKRGPPNGNGGSQLKKAVLPPATGNAMLMKQCETLLNRLMAHNFGWVFNTPVDVVVLKIPDYYTVIKHPMDLGTVKTKLNSGKYVDPWGFAADVRLTFSNAMTYNPRGNDVHIMAETLSKFFEVRWKAIEKKISVRQNVMETDIETANLMPPLKKKKTASFGNELKQEPVKKVMSAAERHKLSSELEASLADLPENIIDFLKENSSNGNATMDDEIEIDIDILSDETLFKLRKLLDDFLVDKQKNMVHNESGFINSSEQAAKVNDVNEENIDIGGNDLPVTSFPPVEIEKDTAGRNTKCSSSSSSSSDSGSSSSGLYSESNGAKLTALVNNIKASLGPEANMEQMLDVPRDAEDSVNRVDPVEQKPQSIPVSAENDGNQEGECAPNERQVSPEKLYRAALLRTRFADTIIKAQEKTVGKVEKQDIERLRLDKEEIEKRRKEEKARLQSEARAAEEAKQKAELEAAAEAQRKRDIEREAARQALQKMEKMVDINDNSRFLEDLEMLSVGPAEPLQSLIDENSTDCYQDPLGSFNLNGKGNPLEQLGLYMKDDDEEDDDEPGTGPAMGDDHDEVEID